MIGNDTNFFVGLDALHHLTGELDYSMRLDMLTSSGQYLSNGVVSILVMVWSGY